MMQIGQKIDNSYPVLGILEQRDDIYLLTVLNGIERYHMLVFSSSTENADMYNNFEHLSFEGAVTSAKNDTLAYVLFPYDDSLSMADYMLCIHRDLSDEHLMNASDDRLLMEIQFYEAMIRSLPEGEKKNLYKKHLQQAKLKLEKQKTKEKATQKRKTPSLFDRFRKKISELKGDIQSAQQKPRNNGTTGTIAAQFDGHYMLSRKNVGASKELKGDVKLFVVMVNDPESKWSDADKAYFLDVCKQSCMFLMDQAKFVYNTTLQLSTVYDTVTLDYILDRRNNAPLSAKLQPIIEHYGARDTSALQQSMESRYGVREAPVIFVVNKPSRPCAMSETTAFKSTPHEWSYIGRTQDGHFHYIPLAHEILHQFGAEDFYHPPKVYQNAKEIFPDSLMHQGYTVDALTAYLVGWTADLLPSAEKFMNSIKDVTIKDYLASLDLENKKTKC